MIATRAASRSLLLGDVRRDAELFARESDVQDPDLVAQCVAMDAEGARRASEISRGSLHRADDVFLLEFLLREIERDAVGQELIDDFLELPVEIHASLPQIKRTETKRGAS